MFAVIETGSKQYKVEKGMTLKIEKLNLKEGEVVTFDKVLLIENDGNTLIGTPIVEGAGVIAKVLKHQKEDKILVFKMKAKKRYRKTQGHRQVLSVIEITDIKTSGVKIDKKAKKTEEKEEKSTAKAPKKETAKKVTTKTTPKATKTAKVVKKATKK